MIVVKFFVYLLLLACILVDAQNTVVVNGVTGNNSLCLQQSNAPCKSIKTTQKYISGKEDVTVIIETNTTLSGLMDIIDATNITICSKSSKKMTIFCRNNSGLKFENVQTFKFENLIVRKCGWFHESLKYAVAMLFISSSDMKFEKSVFYDNDYTALVLINCSHEIHLQKVKFSSNGHRKLRSKSFAAGLSIMTSINSTRYNLTKCFFVKNVSPNNSKTSNETTVWGISRGLGGAFSIIMMGNANNNQVTIHQSKFYHNQGKWGGGVYADFRDQTRKNSILLHSTIFKGNVAGKGGGGANMGFLTDRCDQNIILIMNCRFHSNKALFGGGLAIFSHYFEQNCTSSVVSAISTVWASNIANLGAAVDLTPIDPFLNQRGFLPNPTFRNCTFSENVLQNNNAKTNEISQPVSSGVFIVTRFIVIFDIAVNFSQNNFTALYILSGSVLFKESTNALFDQNIGYSGGAIALYSFSTIVVGECAHLTFTSNHAYTRGGAIFYQTMDQHNFMTKNKNCFIRTDTEVQESSRKAVFIFRNNTADTGGRAMYSESFRECYRFCNTKQKHFNPRFSAISTFSCLGNFTFEDGQIEDELMSSGRQFQITGNNTNLRYSVIPGDTLKLNFKVLADFNHTARFLIHYKSDSSNISFNQPYRWSDTIFPRGEQNSQANLTATTLSVRQYSMPFHVTLLQCPPGFHFTSSCKCATGKRGYGVVLKCNYQTFTARIKSGNWVGYIPDDIIAEENLYYAPCPGSMCNSTLHFLPKSGIGLDQYICRKNRTGILCGKCIQNFTTYYISREFKCGHTRHCKYGLLFYFLSEIIPMVTFFLVVVTFNISFTSGSTTGFILFSQHLAPLEISFSTVFEYTRMPYRFVYGLFNFEYLGIEQLSFCLWNNFQVLDIMAFKYVTIITGLTLVLLFVAILQINACQRLVYIRRRVQVNNSLVHGLSAFLVVCYAQCTKTTFYILKYVTPIGYNNKLQQSYSYYGGLPYFGPKHLLYAVPALISFTLITILPPLVLLLNPLALRILALCGLSEHRIVNKILHLTCMNRLKPFIDCFQGCYKDKLRFFAGLYFLYRVAILSSFLLVQEELHMKLYTTLVFLLILGIHCIAQPYKRLLYNTVNSLVLLNLTLISFCNVLASSIKSQHDTAYDYKYGTGFIILECFQLLLIYLPMCVAITLWGRQAYIYWRNRLKEERREMFETLEIDMHRQWEGIGYERLN